MQTLRLDEHEKHTLKLRAMASTYETFGGLVTMLRREGEARDDASAIIKGRNLRSDLFNKWSAEGRPAI
jgi:hypothetical protein